MDLKGFLDYVGVQKVLAALSNAGLLICRLENSFCFETFELSPTNAAAMTTKGHLVRQFPDTVTEISVKDFRYKAF
ncbi:unnamed protein product [Fusarium graminearum]|uniref:DUF6606 domain-containing protein n=1 Tax=Gibberella zeae TaxID=5518 RepID=A0A9N8NF37_GIBZA|nr:unnamed protein product [Fusarium graminearum]